MLTSSQTTPVSLADVFPSCLASLDVDGFDNMLGLRAARSAIIILVDGLGELNLSAYKAHARFLTSSTRRKGILQTVFPSTTSAALASLTTGSLPGEHGLVGYRVRNPETNILVNQLRELGTVSTPSTWAQRVPLYLAAENAGISTTVISHPRLVSTPLTSVIHAGTTVHGYSSISERFSAAMKFVSGARQQCVLIYISELDEAAHKFGVNSREWTSLLEQLDGACAEFVANLPGDVGVILTADHGIVDVPAHRQVLYGDDPADVEGVSLIGGEPRCLQLYVESPQVHSAVMAHWRTRFGDVAQVYSRDDIIASGHFGAVSSTVADRMGDIFVLATKLIALYDARDDAMIGRAMIGQHGGLSEDEMRIPAITWGAFA